jgi:hypothetical protein
VERADVAAVEHSKADALPVAEDGLDGLDMQKPAL